MNTITRLAFAASLATPGVLVAQRATRPRPDNRPRRPAPWR